VDLQNKANSNEVSLLAIQQQRQRIDDVEKENSQLKDPISNSDNKIPAEPVKPPDPDKLQRALEMCMKQKQEIDDQEFPADHLQAGTFRIYAEDQHCRIKDRTNPE